MDFISPSVSLALRSGPSTGLMDPLIRSGEDDSPECEDLSILIDHQFQQIIHFVIHKIERALNNIYRF